MQPTARLNGRKYVGPRLDEGPPRPSACAAAATAVVESLERRTFLSSSSVAGAVFVATNHNNTHPTAPPDEPANQVVMYSRAADGKLTLVDRFDTGGQGSGPSVRFAGDGLGSAHSVQLSQDGRFLFVVNAASDNISVFRVFDDGLDLVDLEPTGDFPNSVTQDGDTVYVLNSAGQGSITGYHFDDKSGNLTALAGSTRTLNANQSTTRPDTLFNPTQVSFTPDGRQLVVTIKDGPAPGAIPGVTPTGPGRVLVFGVGKNDLPSATYVQTNLNNEGPFGFSFDRKGNLLTSLFVGGPNLTGAAGSFRINDNGTLTPISRNVPNTQLDTCWLENNGTYAWGANYSSGTISSYKIGRDGSLTLFQAVAGTTNDLPGDGVGKTQGSTPLDIRVNPSGEFVYDVLPGSGAVAGWRVNADGTLTKLGEFGGLPDTINGDVAPFEFGPGGSPAGIAAVDFKKNGTPARVDQPGKGNNGKGNNGKGNGHDDDDDALPAELNVVYVQTNNFEKNQNAILAYRRNPDTCEIDDRPFGVFYTHGTGNLNSNDRIGPDDSDQEIIVTPDRRFLFTVNQGSDTVSTFRIRPDGSLRLEGVTKSGGQQPVSVGLSGDVLIVTNKSDQEPSDTAGDRPNYTSFRVRDDGKLKLVKGSTVQTGPGDSPTQSLISRDGKFLFGDNFLARPIPELAPGSSAFLPPYGSELVSFRIGPNGELTPAMAPLPSPFPESDVADQYILGLAAHPTRNIVYTGFVVGNKLGVYTYDNSGRLTFNKAITLTGAGICWIVISPDAKRLYATNFATNSVSVINIEDPLNPVEIQDVVLNGPKPAHPPPLPPFNTVTFQLDLDPDAGCLYVLNHEQDPDNNFPGGNRIAVLKVLPDGKLQEITNSPIVLPQEFVPAAAHPQGIIAL